MKASVAHESETNMFPLLTNFFEGVLDCHGPSIGSISLDLLGIP